MAVSGEAPFVYAFAALLGVGSVLLLTFPLFRHLRAVAADRSVFLVAIVGVLGLSAAALLGITTAPSDATLFFPLAAVTVALRLASPTLLYRGIRDGLEARRSWPQIRFALAIAFVVFALLLAYNLLHAIAGLSPPLVLGLSEQFGMALGASFLIMRTAFRFRPRFTAELWPIWLSATAFAIAFIVVAPYAFPAFAIAYSLSGFVGWIVAIVVLRFVD